MTDMEALEALAGHWTIEVEHPQIDGVVRGEMSVEWLEGGGYLVQRSTIEDTRFPRTISVIGPDRSGERIVQHSFDSRGVARIYDISLDSGVLRLSRDGEDFAQRYTGRFTDDGSAIEGAWERTEADGTWTHDFALTYRRKR
jgi:hypothetical protein